MSNTSSPADRGKRNRKHLHPALWIFGIILVGLTAAAFLLNKPRFHYPEVVIQEGDVLRIGFLQQPYNQASSYDAVGRKVADSMKPPVRTATT